MSGYGRLEVKAPETLSQWFGVLSFCFAMQKVRVVRYFRGFPMLYPNELLAYLRGICQCGVQPCLRGGFPLKTDSRQDAPPVRVFALLARSLASATCVGAKGAGKMLKGPL